MTIVLESQESSSPMITRAVANGLLGKGVDSYTFTKLQRAALRLLGYFPASAAEWLIPRIQPSSALATGDVISLTSRDLVNARLADYSELNTKYPAVVLGIGMGGTTAHLSMALDAPFLPQAFVVTLEKGTLTGNVLEYFDLTHATALKITENNPDLMSIQHYDPVHDGWLVKRVNHLRLKLVDLPTGYKEFIRKTVEKGGEVIYLEGNASWKRFRVGERSVFQVGGWGDISAEEFINGNPRLDEFCKREKLEYSSWRLPGYDVEDGPESEWGSEPGLGESIEMFCSEEGYKYVKIAFDDPNDFSRLAFSAQRKILQKSGIEIPGVIVEMFSQFDVLSSKNAGLLPLWLIFNTKDSLEFLRKIKDEFPRGKPVFFSPLSTFSRTPDLVAWDEWEKALAGFDVINVGARKTHYPADVWALLDWKSKLNRWVEQNKIMANAFVSGTDLLSIAAEIKTPNT